MDQWTELPAKFLSFISTKDNLLAVTGIISAITALCSAFIGPLIALNVAKRQIRNTLVSSNRVKWIEDTRKDLAEFSESQYAITHKRITISNLDEVGENKEILKKEEEKLHDLINKANSSATLIRLKINRREPLGADLLEKMNELIKISSQITKLPTASVADYNRMRSDFEEAAWQFLKKEWDFAKKGK